MCKRMMFHVVCVIIFLNCQTIIAQIPYSEGASKYRGYIGNPIMSLDEKSFYARTSYFSAEKDKRMTDVIHFDLDGNEIDRKLPRSPNMPPNGGNWMAFKDTREGKYGIWVYNIATQQYKFLAPVPSSNAFLGHRAIKNFVWSPDGKQIAYVAAEEKPTKSDTSIKVISRMLYKSRTSFSDNIRTHIFVVSLKGGNPRQLTTGQYDEHSIDWSPDGREIVFVSNRTRNPDDNHNNDLWTVNVRNGKITQITDTPGTELLPSYSPDGNHIAYLAGVRPINTKDSQAENLQLWVIPANGGKAKNLTQPLDRRVRDPKWTRDGKYIFFRANNHGGTHLFRVTVSSGDIKLIVKGKLRVGSYALSTKEKKIVYTRSSHKIPTELYRTTFDGKNHKRLTNIQQPFLQNVQISVPESFWFKSFDGKKVQGWAMKPTAYQTGEQYPTILRIHGGPHGAYGFSVSTIQQILAENGYGVLYINPRGSTGYGQAFADGTINNWGGGDYKDLMAGADFAIAHNSWIDSTRLGVTGGSYGGYMTNWVITQTDRFKAAVSGASVSNLISFYGTSLYQLLIETEFPGELWENFDLLWHWSPLSHVEHVRTPTLFIHGENDHDVPITQAEEMYMALKKLGVEAVLVRYPGEGHGLRKPKHRKDYLKRMLAWFDKYLK